MANDNFSHTRLQAFYDTLFAAYYKKNGEPRKRFPESFYLLLEKNSLDYFITYPKLIGVKPSHGRKKVQFTPSSQRENIDAVVEELLQFPNPHRPKDHVSFVYGKVRKNNGKPKWHVNVYMPEESFLSLVEKHYQDNNPNVLDIDAGFDAHTLKNMGLVMNYFQDKYDHTRKKKEHDAIRKYLASVMAHALIHAEYFDVPQAHAFKRLKDFFTNFPLVQQEKKYFDEHLFSAISILPSSMIKKYGHTHTYAPKVQQSSSDYSLSYDRGLTPERFEEMNKRLRQLMERYGDSMPPQELV